MKMMWDVTIYFICQKSPNRENKFILYDDHTFMLYKDQWFDGLIHGQSQNNKLSYGQ
jgi:hypothetical protein